MKRYTESQIQQVQTLKSQGKTIKRIAALTKIPKGSIPYLLKRVTSPSARVISEEFTPKTISVTTQSMAQISAILDSDMDPFMKVSLMKTLVKQA